LLLVIDVGNTNTVFGLYEECSLVADFRVETRRNPRLMPLKVNQLLFL